MFYSNISNYQLKETKKNNMSQKLNGTICTHLSHFITHFKLYYWLKKYQNKAIRVHYTNERESKNSTSSPTFIYLKGHNPPYHTRPCLSYIKGKILSIYICYLRKTRVMHKLSPLYNLYQVSYQEENSCLDLKATPVLILYFPLTKTKIVWCIYFGLLQPHSCVS